MWREPRCGNATHVVIVAVEQAPELLAHPLLDFQERADRAGPMFARVIPDSLHMPFRASLDVASEFRRAALRDRLRRLQHPHRQFPGLSIRLEMLLEDLLDDRLHTKL